MYDKSLQDKKYLRKYVISYAIKQYLCKNKKHAKKKWFCKQTKFYRSKL